MKYDKKRWNESATEWRDKVEKLDYESICDVAVLIGHALALIAIIQAADKDEDQREEAAQRA